ncbi:riboflavin biosynthesis protein RibF [Hydrogenoanaerobacterium sp.]|uniref:riboflavin biosynthesis protein RibF n=1 Tax=Hydrogenoanaerobacterium sp. TaxID=2953763 RepID=UPI00289A0E71|nr:riboflavin biosynthesis protein RibF [Hydrogenoanaerobacterium sp.]
MNTIGETKGAAIALGFFDGVHRGHQAVVGKAVELACELSLDPCVFTFTTNHGSPAAKACSGIITTEETKEAELYKLGVKEIFCPDFDVFKDMTGEEFVRDMLYGQYRARAVCCGYDFRFGKGAQCTIDDMKQLCGRFGIELCVVPAILDEGKAISSTRIREALREGDIETVNRLLGRRYGFDFAVVHGKRLGRTIDAPTINQPFPVNFALPRFGVYASFAEVEGRQYPAVTSIGVKPTVKSDNVPLAETYIMGIDADFYGKHVPVTLVQFLRPEIKFSSVEELKRNIHRDAQQAMEVCEVFALQ